jgi:sulfate transport system ATP-binding protein
MYVELNHINKNFGRFPALKEVSFAIEKGKMVGLLGPSGSGKTTILRSLAGLERPDSGDILIGGEVVNDLPASRRGIGFVFQNYALFRYMKVIDNIAFGLQIQKKAPAFIRERVNELVHLIGLEGMEDRYPHQLSGGQKQRVAFARALAPNPQLLLLDEPFAAIDAKVRKELRSWLRETINKVGITSIFVTHDQDEAIEVADEIIIINQGRVEQKGAPIEIYNHPTTPFVAKFIGQSAVLENYALLHGFEKVAGYDQAIIRPEFVKVTKKEKNPYPHAAEDAVVESSFFRGNSQELHLRLKDMQVIAFHPLNEDIFSPGETVSILIVKLFLYDQEKVKQVENKTFNYADSIFI